MALLYYIKLARSLRAQTSKKQMEGAGVRAVAIEMNCGAPQLNRFEYFSHNFVNADKSMEESLPTMFLAVLLRLNSENSPRDTKRIIVLRTGEQK